VCCSVLRCVCLSRTRTRMNFRVTTVPSLPKMYCCRCACGGVGGRESARRGGGGKSARTLPERQHQSLRCNACVMPNPQLHPHPHPHQRQHVQPLLHTHTHMSTFVAFWMPLQYTFLPLTSIRQSPGTIPQLHADEPSTSACES